MTTEHVVLFVAALTKWHSYKGLDDLLKAFVHVSEANDARLVIVGDGDLRQYYQTMASSLGIGDVVTFAGDVSHDKLPEYYAACDIFVLPSLNRSEGFGIVILEANACGKPVVGSAVGGIVAAVRQGYNGLLVPSRNPERLAETILTLLRDGHLRTKMGGNGRRLVKQRDWPIVTRQTEELYEQIVATS